MQNPSEFLIDYFIEYSKENDLTFEQAASLLAEFAKQRAPDLAVKQITENARLEMLSRIERSHQEFFIARFMVRTRVRYVRWTYFPEFHLVGEPEVFWWHSIRYDEPKWELKADPNNFYLDNLYHDPELGIFWMDEPYLEGLPESQNLFDELAKNKFEPLEERRKKITPNVVQSFKAARKGLLPFKQASLTDHGYRKPFYGSKGWQKRVSILPKIFKRIRMK